MDKRSSFLSVYYFVAVNLLLSPERRACAFNVDTKSLEVYEGPAGSYFGYSIAILQVSGSTRLLVGAPRDSNRFLPESVKKAGSLYQIRNGTVSPIKIDSASGEGKFIYRDTVYDVVHGKDYQWLGASVDVSDWEKSAVVCAPRWHNKRYSPELSNEKEMYHMNGVCYKLYPQLDSDSFHVEPLPVLVSPHQQNLDLERNFGVAEMGMSVHFTKDGDSLLLGAPGLYWWTGGFVHIYGEGFYSQTVVYKQYGDPTDTSESAGYAITSGLYSSDKRRYFAIGAPRKDLTGQVLIYDGDMESLSNSNPKVQLNGGEKDVKNARVGNYFGAALCTVDVNKDGVDDLLVGAPLFAENVNEGRVFVYLGKAYNSRYMFQVPYILTGGNKINASFGSAITSLGDMNNDGYNDVAIGAPYEDSNGAVYIYNGCYKGLWHEHTQRISGGGFRAFGISFSRAYDINADTVNDFAVGAYKSDQVVLFFGRPIVHIRAGISTSKNVVNYFDCRSSVETPCFTASFCVIPINSSIESIVLNVNLSFNGDQRVSFASGGAVTTSKQQVLIAKGTADACTEPSSIYTLPTRDIIRPVAIAAKYEEININLKSQAPIKPMLNRFNGSSPYEMHREVHKWIYFTNNCPDNVCRTDLKLNATITYNGTDNVFIAGTSTLSVDVVVGKAGDPSYLPEFNVTLPASLEYRRTDSTNDSVQCDVDNKIVVGNVNNNDTTYQSNNYRVILCSLGRQLESDNEVSFTLHFKVPNNITEDSFKFVMNVSSRYGDEINPVDNVVNFSLPVQRELSSYFSGVSRPEAITVLENKKKNAISHVYEIRNEGPSILQKSNMIVKFPQVQDENSDHLVLNSTEANCPAPCQVKCGISGAFIGDRIYKTGILHNENTIAEMGIETDVKQLDCRVNVCTSLVCDFRNVPPQHSGILSLNFIVDHSLLKVASNGKSVQVTSTAEVLLEDERLITDAFRLNVSVETDILPSSLPPEEVSWWIIVVSVASGLIVIVVIALIMWRVGFFQRKTKDELNVRRTLYESEKRKTMMAATGDVNVQLAIPKEGDIENPGYGIQQ